MINFIHIARINLNPGVFTLTKKGTSMKSSQPVFKISAICFSTWLTMGYILPANAAIVVDQQKSPATSVSAATTGATIVNISAPTSGGVSHNIYSQFNVDPTGVILNNSSNASATSLGGNISGNSNMANGSATVILNEVNSRNPSQLNGMIEVAGQKAAVVIANPSGITCNGCGFINASRSTLVTGSAEMSNGQLTGFNVNGGEIQISGKGMNDRDTGYTDIISRSVTINSRLQVQDLRVVTGSNNVDYQSLNARKIKPDASSIKPSLALDVSKLGGMYANKIQLIGTESGVGVRNNGAIRAEGIASNLTLNINGKLENNGVIDSNNVLINTQKNTLDNDYGTISARDSITIDSGNIDNNVDGSIVASGTLFGNKGTITINTHGQSLDNGQKGISGNDTVTLNVGKLTNNGWIASNSKLDITASDAYTNNGSIYGENVSVNSASLSNNGLMQSSGDMLVNTSCLSNNSAGLIDASGKLNIQSKDITNSGEISADTADIYASQSINNRAGKLYSDSAAVINTKNLINTQGKISSDGSLEIIASSLQNSTDWYTRENGGKISAAAMTIKTDSLNNDRGKISGGSLDIYSGTVDIANGSILTTGDISINSTSDFFLDNEGQIQSGTGSIEINAAKKISNDGLIEADSDLSLSGKTISNDHLIISDQGNLVINATDTIENTRGGYMYGRDGFSITAKKSITNAGEFITNGPGYLKAKAITNSRTGYISADFTNIYVDKTKFVNNGEIDGGYYLN